jgi:hypothetical protein
MSAAKLNPVDGLPEWKGRRVITEREKARTTKRARRFVMVGWGELVPIMVRLKFTRASRLLFVLLLHRNLQRVGHRDGWVRLERKDLASVGLADSNLTKAVAKLETAGLVEVQRRPGKRPLIRLVKQEAD